MTEYQQSTKGEHTVSMIKDEHRLPAIEHEHGIEIRRPTSSAYFQSQAQSTRDRR
jgi:hypothetical protein